MANLNDSQEFLEEAVQVANGIANAYADAFTVEKDGETYINTKVVKGFASAMLQSGLEDSLAFLSGETIDSEQLPITKFKVGVSLKALADKAEEKALTA